MPLELPGIAFEKLVAAIQSQIDPSSNVSHDEKVTDRLGHERQFDIVIRGNFAGQPMLGVIECKDLKRRVGNPDLDAFVTKSQDINANFKILMSRSGFTKPALEKCRHYGVQALSLLENDPINKNFFLGIKWTADVTRWGQVSVTLHFLIDPAKPVSFHADNLRINGRSVLDWFTNYLIDQEPHITELGWVVGISVVFDSPQRVETEPGVEYVCTSIDFMAERLCDKLERMVGISGTGFFNWNLQKATFPPGSTITSDAVPTDFTLWKPRTDKLQPPSSFFEIHIKAKAINCERKPDAIDLGNL
jgi:hypothetical protein